MDGSTVAHVIARPEQRSGPAALELASIGVLFLVPGLVAPLLLLTAVGAAWILGAIVVAATDLVRSAT